MLLFGLSLHAHVAEQVLEACAASTNIDFPLVELLHWASPPTVAASSNAFQNATPEDVYMPSPSRPNALTTTNFKPSSVSAICVAPANFTHGPVGNGKTNVRKCAIHGK